VKDKLDSFARFGRLESGGVTRLTFSPAELGARREFQSRMEALGAVVSCDDMANMYATIGGSEPGLPGIVMASHIDSVKSGGNFDGVLGVIAAMEVLETMVREKIPHRRAFTAMIWTNEEGSRFAPAMMSSGVICGKLDKAAALDALDSGGVTFGEALSQSGFAGSREKRLNRKDYAAMLELHIEQGPVLEEAQKNIGVVCGVQGMVNYRIAFQGRADHAGAMPMRRRRDALLAAASALKLLHAALNMLDPDLVYTTGELVLRPGVHSVVPDYVEFSLDARHRDPKVLDAVVHVIASLPETLDQCAVTWRRSWARDTVLFDPTLLAAIEKSAAALGYSSMPLYSGAGHDAQYCASLLPTAMIFVPSKDGRSHCPDEWTSLDDAWRGINVALNTVLALSRAP
jgi:N-carbamoyl-L-amino-acid hydrolase